MKKNILAHLDFFPPSYNAGAERYIFTMLKHLQDEGHTVTVLTEPKMGKDGYTYEGILVRTDQTVTDELYANADYVMTQIAYSAKVNELCKRKKKKLIYLVHNTKSIPYWNIKPEDVWLTVWNADWVRNYTHNILRWKSQQEMTLYPPVLFDRYHLDSSERNPEYITLVNMGMNKGILTFIQAAKMLPDQKFLGVVGAYDTQHTQNLPKNITVIPHTPNMLENVYSKSKVILMPSLKETWGMVAIEGFCSGIPCVAHPTEGLVEACGSAGLFAHRDKAFIWEGLIKKLLNDEEFYEEHSEKCLNRALELSILAEEQLIQFERILSEDESL